MANAYERIALQIFATRQSCRGVVDDYCTNAYQHHRQKFLTCMAHIDHAVVDGCGQNKHEILMCVFHLSDPEVQKRIRDLTTFQLAKFTGVFYTDPELFTAMEESCRHQKYEEEMAAMWCVNKQFADMKGDKKFHNCTMMLLANTGFASMGRGRVFVTI
jgi:hypothetical protein